MKGLRKRMHERNCREILTLKGSEESLPSGANGFDLDDLRKIETESTAFDSTSRCGMSGQEDKEINLPKAERAILPDTYING